MLSRYRAQIGLGAFAIVLALSLVILVAGFLSPTYARPLMVGDRFPDFALSDETGTIHEFESLRTGAVLVVYAPTNGLTQQQSMRIADLRKQLGTKLRVLSVAVLPTNNAALHPRAHELCELVLLDSDQSLWPIRGTRSTDASVCLVDHYGYLRLRADLPEQEVIAERPIDRPVTRHALAILSQSVIAR